MHAILTNDFRLLAVREDSQFNDHGIERKGRPFRPVAGLISDHDKGRIAALTRRQPELGVRGAARIDDPNSLHAVVVGSGATPVVSVAQIVGHAVGGILVAENKLLVSPVLERNGHAHRVMPSVSHGLGQANKRRGKWAAVVAGLLATLAMVGLGGSDRT